ncbi:MAG: HAMP domain-containing protein [Desulfosarcinaceae bacterium]|nr:HAMP domain-containing protein [Desulfosarcinaceae bacterium]
MSTTESYLTAVCQACDKRYGILAQNITGKGGRFVCRSCGAMVVVHKDASAPPVEHGVESLPDWVHSVESDRTAEIDGQVGTPVSAVSDSSPHATHLLGAVSGERAAAGGAATDPAFYGTATSDRTSVSDEPTVIRDQQAKPVSTSADAVSARSAYRFGLTAKFLLFTLTPLVIISVLSLLYSIDKMLTFQKATIAESTHIVKGISEGMLRQIANTVARQTRQYLFSHPDLKREDFNRDIYFKKVAIQRVGITGNTSLYEVAGADGIWRAWADIDAKLVGRNLADLKGQLGKHFDTYWELLTGVKAGKIVSGYYYWPDDEGNFREKYMVCAPVEGTPYAVSASIYVDEITVPLMKIEERGTALAREMRNSNAAIMGGGLLLLALILFLYGRGLTQKIHSLSAWADRISLGELDLETSPVTSNDELGELSEAIARMQDSIRLSVERLRTRRR